MALTDPLSIRQLEVFVALQEQGSFTKAAQSLGLSQSTVSGHMADLERRLGVRLVDRDRSGVRLTAAGTALLRPAREVLQSERNARMAVEELSGLLSGTLLVGGSTIPASYLLPGMFARFHEAHPGVSLRLVAGDSREILARVRAADAEVGVVGTEPPEGDLPSRPVGEDTLVFVVGAEHPLAKRKRLTVDALLDYPLVMREPGSGTRSAAETALESLLGTEAMEDLHVACELGSTEALKAAVRYGMGGAFISNLAIEDELAHGVLKTVAIQGFEVRRRFHLVSREESLLSPAARAFRDIALRRT